MLLPSMFLSSSVLWICIGLASFLPDISLFFVVVLDTQQLFDDLPSQRGDHVL